MTRAEALAEAQRRWGSGGFARTYKRLSDDSTVFTVGRGGRHHDERGRLDYYGDTWEDAFKDADRRAAR